MFFFEYSLWIGWESTCSEEPVLYIRRVAHALYGPFPQSLLQHDMSYMTQFFHCHSECISLVWKYKTVVGFQIVKILIVNADFGLA